MSSVDDALKQIEDWDYTALLGKVKGDDPDKWFCSMLEQSMDIIKKKEIFPHLRSAANGKFVLYGDKYMSTLYEKERQQLYGNASFCLADNYHLHPITILTYASLADIKRPNKSFTKQTHPPNHIQRPDGLAVMCFKTENGEERTMTVVYEGENHDKNATKDKGGGGWLWNKMFQAMGRCHDIDNNVSGVMISAVMHKHNRAHFNKRKSTLHFPEMARAYLKAHVLLLVRLLDYNRKTTKTDSWIGRNLKRIGARITDTEHYDFVCTINATIHGTPADDSVSFTGGELLNQAATSEGGEYENYLKSVRDLYPRTHDHEIELGDRLRQWKTSVYRMQFTTGGDGVRGMNVVIHAVLRAPSNALSTALSRTEKQKILGVLYPKHIDQLIAHIKSGKQRKESLIPRRPKQKIFEVPSKELEMFLQWIKDAPPAPPAAAVAPAGGGAAPGAAGGAPAAPPVAPPRKHVLRGNWMFGLQLRNIRSVWNLWNQNYKKIEENRTTTNAWNNRIPRRRIKKSYLQMLEEKKKLQKRTVS